jgi:hypothetical protein
MTQYRVYVVEVTVEEPDENNDTWMKIGGALESVGFDDVLYGECFPMTDEEN